MNNTVDVSLTHVYYDGIQKKTNKIQKVTYKNKYYREKMKLRRYVGIVIYIK